MKTGDYLLQAWRMSVAARWIPPGSRVLDIGCFQGDLFRWLGDKIDPSVGIDPLYEPKGNPEQYHQFLKIPLNTPLPFPDHSFDIIVLLATIEHIQDGKIVIAREAKRLLRNGGRVVITAPSLAVDKILDFLLVLHLIDGMSLEEHHGFDPGQLPSVFTQEGFKISAHHQFQFGLNNLFVFENTLA